MSHPACGVQRYRPPCGCSTTTPVRLRVRRHACEVHKYLRPGEAVYMVAGEPPRFVRRSR